MKKKLTILGLCVVLVLAGVPIYTRFKRAHSFKKIENSASEYIKQSGIDCAVLIKDLTYPKLEFVYGRDKKFPAASIVKIHILSAALKGVKEQKISLNTKITIKRKDITGGSGKIKAMKLPVEFTFNELLEAMVAGSDNTATNKVISLLSFDYINKSIEELGGKNTILRRPMMDFVSRRKGIENYTDINDVAFFLEKIYNKHLVSRRLSELALSLLKKQKVNDRIPKLLPKDTIVAHKTGLERGILHDAGIVFTDSGDYMICVLSKGIKGYKQGKSFIAQLSLLVYDFYKK
ncbi:MAG: serine hydrolase [Candidatus Omnitrophica bacterium]|nr:serine hydrolase [Candidatus Omnitrophota bacterium]